VGPALWSTSETEVLVLSANLPSLNPIFRRLRPKSRKEAKGILKDEESSHILENLDLGGHKAQPAVGAPDAGILTTAVCTVESSETAPLPEYGIFVEMGLEQNVRSM